MNNRDTTGSPPIRWDLIVNLIFIVLLVLNIALGFHWRRTTPPLIFSPAAQQTRTQYEKTLSTTGKLANIVPERVEKTQQKAGEIADETKRQVDALSHVDIAAELNAELGFPAPGNR